MRELLLLVCCVAGVTIAPGSFAEPSATTPLVIAHRGGAQIAPENTLAAFEEAVELGVDMIEFDTRMTADGEIVVMHDATVDRTTYCSGAVISMTLAEVTSCDASKGWPSYLDDPKARVPSLAQIVDFLLEYDDLLADIEINWYPADPGFPPDDSSHVDKVIDHTRPIADRVIIQSFLPTYLEQARMADGSQRVAITTSFASSTAFQPAHNGLAYLIVRGSGFDVAQPQYESPDLDADFMNRARLAGKVVYTWTVNDVAGMSSMWQIGVDGIMTDRPDLLLDLLSST